MLQFLSVISDIYRGGQPYRKRKNPINSGNLPKEHYVVTSKGYNSSECPHCKEEIISTSLKSHLSRFHGNLMPFQCQLCGKGFQSVSGLHHHTLAHEGRKFMCTICDSRFNQKSHLKTHLNKIHKLVQCSICSQIFGIGPEFNQHMLQNH
jgi:transcription elongation factor Elf1